MDETMLPWKPSEDAKKEAKRVLQEIADDTAASAAIRLAAICAIQRLDRDCT